MAKFRLNLARLSRPLLRRAYSAMQSAHDSHSVENLARSLGRIGVGCNIAPTVKVIRPKHVQIGNNVFIGDRGFIHGEGGVQIRDNVHISRNVTIYGSDHDFRNQDVLPYGVKRRWDYVVIEQNVWIGMNACILPGVRIGEGAIIGMGAVISKNVAPGEIVVQASQRVVGKRDMARYATANRANSFGGRNGRPLSQESVSNFWPTGRVSHPQITSVASTGRSGTQSFAKWLTTTLTSMAVMRFVSHL